LSLMPINTLIDMPQGFNQMSQSKIALTELVKNLGYERPSALSNWVRDIVKNKEDFYKKFSIEQKKEGRADGRDEKFRVTSDAKIFVDNLCILKPYKSFFEKSNDNTSSYSPYQALKKGNHKKNLLIKAQKVKAKLFFEKQRNENALKELSKLVSVFEYHDEIDITTVSLRELIKEVDNSKDILDFSKSFEIAAWNDLLDLQDQLREEESSVIYRKIGEKILELGDFSEAIEALNNATSISHDDGIAWSLKAKIYLDLLKNSKQDQIHALARTEFSGFIEHPLNGEELWINERIEESFSSYESLHTLFIEACFYALEYWPHWENLPVKSREGVERKNFMPISTAEISRDWLFFHFIINLDKSDLMNETNANRFINIFKTFQRVHEPLPDFIISPFSIEFQKRTLAHLKLIEILSWVSSKDCSQLLDVFINNFKTWKSSAAKNLIILSSSNIRRLFWNHLGKEKFLSLYSLLESYAEENRKIDQLESISSIQLDLLLSDYNKIIKEPARKEFYFEYIEPTEQDALRIKERWSVFITQSLEKIIGSNTTYTEKIWDDETFSSNTKKSLSFFFICSLIELQNQTPSDISLKIISKFSESEPALKIVVDNLPDELLNELLTLIIDNYSDQEYLWVIKINKISERIKNIQLDDLY